MILSSFCKFLSFTLIIIDIIFLEIIFIYLIKLVYFSTKPIIHINFAKELLILSFQLTNFYM